MRSPIVSKDERELLRHALGLDVSNVPYRNYFCVNGDNENNQLIKSLVVKGLMFQNPNQEEYYHVTDSGLNLMGPESYGAKDQPPTKLDLKTRICFMASVIFSTMEKPDVKKAVQTAWSIEDESDASVKKMKRERWVARAGSI